MLVDFRVLRDFQVGSTWQISEAEKNSRLPSPKKRSHLNKGNESSSKHHFSGDVLVVTRWAPTIVINGIITPINGRKSMGNWGYNW